MSPEEIAKQAWEGYERLGLAFIFMVAEIFTIIYFYKDIREQRDKSERNMERLHTALAASTEVNRAVVESNEEVKKFIVDANQRQSDFVSFLKGRDSVR